MKNGKKLYSSKCQRKSVTKSKDFWTRKVGYVTAGAFKLSNQLIIDSLTIKALGKKTRVEILKALEERRMTQAELSQKLKVSETSISRHLKHLQKSGLVTYQDSGRKWKYIELTIKGTEVISSKKKLRNKLVFQLFTVMFFSLLMFTLLFETAKHSEEIKYFLGIEKKENYPKPTAQASAIPSPSPEITSIPAAIAPSPSLELASPSPDPTRSPTPSYSPTPSPSSAPTQFNFEISIEPASSTISPGDQTLATIIIHGVEPKTVALALTGCPEYTVCEIDTTTDVRNTNPRLRITTTAQTNIGNYQITVTAIRESITRDASYNFSVQNQWTVLTETFKTKYW